MLEKEKLEILRLLTQAYVVNILEVLKTPKRFKELTKICKNERTLTLRLKMLQEKGLITTIPVKDRGKFFNSYVLTDKGKKVLEFAKKIEKMKL